MPRIPPHLDQKGCRADKKRIEGRVDDLFTRRNIISTTAIRKATHCFVRLRTVVFGSVIIKKMKKLVHGPVRAISGQPGTAGNQLRTKANAINDSTYVAVMLKRRRHSDNHRAEDPDDQHRPDIVSPLNASRLRRKEKEHGDSKFDGFQM